MGFFDTWKVANITTDFSKQSECFYYLALAVDGEEYDNSTMKSLSLVGHSFIELRKSFDAYFDGGIKREKNDAVKFLVAFTTYSMGKDGMIWDWQQVRHHSQGLYGSMEESPAHFLHYNTPLVKKATSEIIKFTNKNS